MALIAPCEALISPPGGGRGVQDIGLVKTSQQSHRNPKLPRVIQTYRKGHLLMVGWRLRLIPPPSEKVTEFFFFISLDK